MDLTQTEWVITAISGGILAIVTGTIKYWVAKIKRHSERLTTLEKQMILNDQKDKEYRDGLSDRIKLQILELK